MTIEIISRSISTKVLDRAGIELMIPGSDPELRWLEPDALAVVRPTRVYL